MIDSLSLYVLLDPMCSTGLHNVPYHLRFLYQTCTISLHTPEMCDEYNTWFTSGPLHSRPRYHDTASQRTLASFKMQTDNFSACMPACFHLLLMNHLARTHCFMYTRRFYSNLKSPEHVFLPGPYHLFPTAWKHRRTGSGTDRRFNFLWVFHLHTSMPLSLVWIIHLGLYVHWQPFWLWLGRF